MRDFSLFLICALISLNKSLSAYLAGIPGPIEAVNFWEYDEVSNNQNLESMGYYIRGMAGGERAEYRITNNNGEGFFSISYMMAGNLAEIERGPVNLILVLGNECIQADNSFVEDSFSTGSEAEFTEFVAEGYLQLPSGESIVSLCFVEATGLMLSKIMIDVLDIEESSQSSLLPSPSPAAISTPAPTHETLLYNKIPGTIEAENFSYYSEDYLSSSFTLSEGFFLEYQIENQKTGSYNIEVNMRAEPTDTPIQIVIHFEIGITECIQSNEDQQFPTISIQEYMGSDKNENFSTDIALELDDLGIETITVCVDEGEQIMFDTFKFVKIGSSEDGSSGTLLGSELYTLLIIVGGGSAIALFFFIVKKLFDIALGSTKARPDNLGPTFQNNELNEIEDLSSDGSTSSPFAGLKS
mmetsp:Transcript_20881/g.30974  ORF Transcript_20881/g.30974 Transcript_20881/m.30974 type:complete len:412 (+) Transcript_20881:83-1318(+)